MTLNEQIYGIVFNAILENNENMELNVLNAEMATEDIQVLLLQSQLDLLNECYTSQVNCGEDVACNVGTKIQELKQQINNLTK